MYDKAGKVPRMRYETNKESAPTLGTNLRWVVCLIMLAVLLLFAVHCTWVTSHAYSSPSIVLASYGNDG